MIPDVARTGLTRLPQLSQSTVSALTQAQICEEATEKGVGGGTEVRNYREVLG
jgi:hypothetical protein